MTYDVMEIAKKIIARTDINCEDLISNLKLQKLLYYMQGFHLACFDEPLFNDEIKAWTYGPVVPRVYNEYKIYGGKSLPHPEGDIIRLTDEEENIFEQVYREYAQFSAFKLADMTHHETPWMSTEPDQVIPLDVLKKFFDTRIV